jgi:hypothetical protein
MIKAALSLLAVVASLAFAAPGAHAQSAWDKVAAALGKTGTEMPGQVYRVGFPRTDLKVSVDGVEIKPTFALGGWLAFKSMGAEDMELGKLGPLPADRPV